MKKTKLLISSLGLSLFFTANVNATPEQQLSNAEKGEQAYKQHCAACHDQGLDKAPKVEDLRKVSQSQILLALEIGRMQVQAAALSKDEKSWVAEYLSGGKEQDTSWIDKGLCSKPKDYNSSAKVYSAGWGIGEHNNRFQSAELAGISKENVSDLKLKWAFGFPQVNDMRNQPVFTEDSLFVGSKSGYVLALAPDSGCIQWQTQVASGVRSSIVLGEHGNQRALFFADDLANVYALSAESGKQLWKINLSLFPTSLITGTPTYSEGQLFVPISSYEVAAAGSPQYPCCRSHGAVIALNAQTGEQLWQWHATEHAIIQGVKKNGVEQWGPSGAVVWTTPTVDRKRGLVYFGTGENTSKPATDTSDAIVALDIKTGEEKWKFQALANDVWNAACLNGGESCPKDSGPDFDFGASVILLENAEINSKKGAVLLAGQKSGEVFALDPDDNGKVLWRNRISQGTTNGGIHWGMSVEDKQVFVPIADPEREIPGYTPKPGLYALDIASGKINWSAPVQRDCEFDMQHAPKIGLEQVRSGKKRSLEDRYACSWYYGLSAASTSIPGVVFAAGLDGKLRAYDSGNGKILWQTATAVPFKTVNRVNAHGGAIDVDGAVIGKGMLFINSGYSMFGQLPGDVLLAYEVK